VTDTARYSFTLGGRLFHCANIPLEIQPMSISGNVAITILVLSPLDHSMLVFHKPRAAVEKGATEW
jgi:hypothetical protein